MERYLINYGGFTYGIEIHNRADKKIKVYRWPSDAMFKKWREEHRILFYSGETKEVNVNEQTFNLSREGDGLLKILNHLEGGNIDGRKHVSRCGQGLAKELSKLLKEVCKQEENKANSDLVID